MKGKRPLTPRPSPATLEETARGFLRQLDPHKIVYLNKRGAWDENPQTLRDRISHTLLFNLWSRSQKKTGAFFEKAFFPFLEEGSWRVVDKLGASLLKGEPPGIPPEQLSFLRLFEVLLWVVEQEAYRLNAQAHVPEWNREARAFKNEYQKKLQQLEEQLNAELTAEERSKFFDDLSRVKKAEHRIIEPTAELIAEQEKINSSLETLLQEAAAQPHREEIDSVIVEKIQPPMGIVTQTSPALFFPCLNLLLDKRIDVSSGIPYMASVLLSVFQDPRSTGGLLQALELYPVRHTKIRENIIYTLGNLREGRSVDALAEVLEEPDERKESTPEGEKVYFLLEQKEEAIWALGKIGFDAVRAVPALVQYADHSSARLKTYLAWTLGELGKAQKEKSGGVSADIVIAILKLLKEKNRQVFEEAVSALKKIDMPEFIHSLYLYHAGAISILGLKPAQRGLYELSETLHHLLQTKRRTIMAVNGDSGTGKTYFCQAIAAGFAGIQPSEILYLMRDTKRGQKIFNRLLSLKWLKRHIDPAYYQDYPVSEEEDDPEAYFRQFLEENSAKRLIILDGCRDRHYFQKVIDFFYNKGELDVEVNFRANFSTRRLNLEEREFVLESVKLHLAFLEEPALEDTSFYQEGMVILYDLDNSHASRLSRQETKELFEKRRIDSWGELIRIGDFSGEGKPSECRQEALHLHEQEFSYAEEEWPDFRVTSFSPEERKLKPTLNEDLESEPNLLKTIPLGQVKPSQIRFYAQDQIAGRGENGAVFVLTLLDNRIFQTNLKGATDIALLGRTLYLVVPGQGLFSLSFERNEMTTLGNDGVSPVKIASFPPDRIITAQEDGFIRVRDFLDKRTFVFPSHLPEIASLAVDQKGRIYAGGGNGGLRQWDLEEKKTKYIEGMDDVIGFVRPYPHGKILAVEKGGIKGSCLKIIDFGKNIVRTIQPPLGEKVTGVNVYYDGRIIAGFGGGQNKKDHQERNLIVLSPKEDACTFTLLAGHGRRTTDCLAMGPRIITSGIETDGSPTIRLWGSEFYVRTELGKLFIKP
jgi:WD40 repeat protein